VDYERGSDSEVGDEPGASETPAETTLTETESADAQPAEAPPAVWSDNAESPSPDFGSDADVMNDAFSTSPAPPEWPAVDLDPAQDEESAETYASDAIAAAYAAAGDDTDDELGDVDIADDSDAPVLEDAAAAAAAALAGQVRAESVNVTETGVQSIEAANVSISQGGAGQVRAESMSVEQGGVGLARVGSLTLGTGASAFAVVADEATVEEGSNAFLVVSRKFNGDVQPTVDWRAALAFGAGLGLILSIFRRRR
jgi:hypothetical protein